MLIVTKHIWFPMYYQIFLKKDSIPVPPVSRKYLRSVWIGFTAPFLNLPGMVVSILIGSNQRILSLFQLIFLSFIGLPILGLMGRVYALDVSQESAQMLRGVGL